MNDFFYIREYVNSHFPKEDVFDHERISNEFMHDIGQQMDNGRFENLLIHSGYIPDLYGNDSSEEVLFAKLIEGLVCEWAKRMDFDAELIKQKASMEDVKITINNQVIVCDAKSFRLGRSQAAPNAKDFLKLEDIRKWMSRYDNCIGGLVTYPCTHEWAGKSDIYQYCSTKNAPTLMLPFKYLAYLLHYKNNFDTRDLIKLWDYETMFPHILEKNIEGGNKVAYWRIVNEQICSVTRTSLQQLDSYMNDANELITRCINANLSELKEIRSQIIQDIKSSIEQENDIEKLKETIQSYQIEMETRLLDNLITRIEKFRL